MASSSTELELFHQFISDKLGTGGKTLGLDEALRAFRTYQQELAALRGQVEPALDRSLRGESKPFDSDHLKARVTEELVKKEIRE